MLQHHLQAVDLLVSFHLLSGAEADDALVAGGDAHLGGFYFVKNVPLHTHLGVLGQAVHLFAASGAVDVEDDLVVDDLHAEGDGDDVGHGAVPQT